ncbi:Wzz/FepE/Etk N-terminal domain-containing protein [Acidobacteriota bacterium]
MDTEWELIDYLRIIWRKKWLIICLPILGVLVAAVIVFSLDPVYEISAMIEVGKHVAESDQGLIEVKPLVNPQKIINQWNEIITEVGEVTSLDSLKLIEAHIVNNEILKISLRHTEVDLAKRMLAGLIQEINKKLEVESELVLSHFEENLRFLEAEKRIFVETIELLKAKKLLMEKRSVDRLLLADVKLEILLKERTLNSVDTQLNKLRSRAERIEFSTVTMEPTASSSPVRPKKKIALLIVFLFSIIVSTMFAFLMDYMERARNSKKI